MRITDAVLAEYFKVNARHNKDKARREEIRLAILENGPQKTARYFAEVKPRPDKRVVGAEALGEILGYKEEKLISLGLVVVSTVRQVSVTKL